MVNPLLGAIIGDLAGKPYESRRYNQLPEKIDLMSQNTDFTDDTVLTIAVADALLTDRNFGEKIFTYARRYPQRGYGGNFRRWMSSDSPKPYNSFGNGSAMRVSPVAWAANTIEEALQLAEASAEVTHNHPEGIKGAKAIAGAIYLAKKGTSKEHIKQFVANLGYKLNFDIESIRPFFCGGATNLETIPVVTVAFLESKDYISAIYKSIYIGGDTDTQAAVAGSIALAYYKQIPQEYVKWAYSFLPQEFIEIMNKFEDKFLNK